MVGCVYAPPYDKNPGAGHTSSDMSSTNNGLICHSYRSGMKETNSFYRLEYVVVKLVYLKTFSAKMYISTNRMGKLSRRNCFIP